MPFPSEKFHLSRRKLLRYGAGSALGVGLAGSGVPLFHGAETTVRSAPIASPRLTASGANIPTDPSKRTLVVLQLSGGNDGLNTIVPFTDPQYARLRPTIKQAPETVISLTNNLALNGNLQPLFNYWNSGQLAVIEGVEYPQPNFSHFRGTEIWMTGDDQQVGGLGWIGHSLDHLGSHPALVAVSLGVTVPQALVGRQPIDIALGGSLSSFAYRPAGGQVDPAVISALYDYMATNNTSTSNPYKKLIVDSHETAQQAIAGVAAIAKAGYTPAVTYPRSSLAGGLQTVAQMIHGGVGARVLFVSTSGFDTHVTQKTVHDGLLATLAQALDAFFQDLTAHGLADGVTLMTFSEFGRRPGENASQGTDHGSASVMFVMGPSVTGGMYGTAPSLDAAHLPGGNLIVQQDFRQVYASLLQDWLGFSATDVLPYGPYQPLPLFAARPAVTPPPHVAAPVATVAGGGAAPVAAQPIGSADIHPAPTPVAGANPTAAPLPQPARH